MRYTDIVEMLQSEMDDAETSIDDIEETIAAMEEDITNLQNELSFVEGRRCLACALLCHLDSEQTDEV